MPVKRISSRANSEISNDEIYQRPSSKKQTWAYCLIIVIIFVFALNVTYEIYDNMMKKFSVSEPETRNCMMDFQKSNCNAHKMNDDCQKLFQCVQKERKEETSTKVLSLLEFLID